MELLEIKKNCKIIENKEKNGEELYFDEKPSKNILETLKSNGYKWHNQKKCWYRKLDCIKNNSNKKSTKKEKKNYLGVKVGDIFSFSWGYEQTNINYFQVVGLKGEKSVVIREIKKEIVNADGYESYQVIPRKNDFLDKKKGFLKDNEIGVTKQVKGLKDGTIYINIDTFGFCSLWDGKPDNMTCYY